MNYKTRLYAGVTAIERVDNGNFGLTDGTTAN